MKKNNKNSVVKTLNKKETAKEYRKLLKDDRSKTPELSDEEILQGNERLLNALHGLRAVLNEDELLSQPDDTRTPNPPFSSTNQIPIDSEIDKLMNFGKLLKDYKKAKKAKRTLRIVNKGWKFLVL